uniref:Uncharacterized protein n=1 Tax=uncultured Desulfobacterium sp. TaxID=201089 RepID=E1YMR5_9BACT|nr:unknown protein [uncultured Desulfobacterium sp.]
MRRSLWAGLPAHRRADKEDRVEEPLKSSRPNQKGGLIELVKYILPPNLLDVNRF